MSEWTDDLTIPLPPGKAVSDVVDLVVRAAVAGASSDEIEHRLVHEFGLSVEDAELARDRAFGGLVRAATGNPANCPEQAKDPVAWESFQLGIRDPSIVARLYPGLVTPR